MRNNRHVREVKKKLGKRSEEEEMEVSNLEHPT